MIDVIKFVPQKDRCVQCGQHATKLCDAVIGYSHTFYRSFIEYKHQNRFLTCDALLCDDCTAGQGKIAHFCKKHAGG